MLPLVESSVLRQKQPLGRYPVLELLFITLAYLVGISLKGRPAPCSQPGYIFGKKRVRITEWSFQIHCLVSFASAALSSIFERCTWNSNADSKLYLNRCVCSSERIHVMPLIQGLLFLCAPVRSHNFVDRFANAYQAILLHNNCGIRKKSRVLLNIINWCTQWPSFQPLLRSTFEIWLFPCDTFICCKGFRDMIKLRIFSPSAYTT